MAYVSGLNALLGTKQQGINTPNWKNLGKPAMIEVVASPKSKAIKKKMSQPEEMRQTFEKMRKNKEYSDGTGVGP